MITYVDSSIFESPAQVLVNTVNTVGVMGKGIALEFKRIYPEMEKLYRNLCDRKQFSVGQLWLYKTPQKWILNFPTKTDWRRKSQLEYIELGLQKFVTTYREKRITSISFPRLGCGNGELNWDTQARPLMERYLRELPITIYIHLYRNETGLPEHRNVEETRKWLHSELRFLPFTEFWTDMESLLSETPDFMLNTGESAFAAIADDHSGIWFQPQDGDRFFISREEYGFLDLWQYICDAGYCMPDKLPVGLGSYAPYLIALLSKLPYLQVVEIASKATDSRQIGLKLHSDPAIVVIPPPNMVSLEL